MSKTMTIGPKGQVVIPIEFRDALGIQPGDSVVFEKEGDTLQIRTRKSVVAKLKGKFSDIPVSLSRELLEERRDEVETNKPKAW